MRAVLGIDAAWTSTQPSGVAVAFEGQNGWRLVAVEDSYENFYARAENKPRDQKRPSGSTPDASQLLASAEKLCGCPIDLVAIDMPLARSPIVGRRCSDDAVSKAYGARQCGTHSPSALRPGRISDDLRKGFEQAGYPLCTDKIACPGIVEVYPHPALVELAGAEKRLPYKVAKVRSYWPHSTPSERRGQLYRQWTKIIAALDKEVDGVASAFALSPLSADADGWKSKAYEDSLDAVVCAWVAVCCLNTQAAPYGDEDSSVWIPNPSTVQAALTG